MFNSISREKLIFLIRKRYPNLAPFAEALYAEPGYSIVKMSDAIVLHEILTELQELLNNIAAHRRDIGILGDDNRGTLGFILAYVGDCNALVALEDIEPLLDKFKELAEPLGAIMNTEKTRILTSTNNTSTVQLLQQSHDLNNKVIAHSLQNAIAKYSQKKTENNTLSPYEVTDGLRVLAAPIGSRSFCNSFLIKAMSKAQQDASKLTSSHLTYTRTSPMAYPTIGTAGKELSMVNFPP
eukprot:scaffold72361_cov40-Cyclotella_meneghiniana.AAC.4